MGRSRYHIYEPKGAHFLTCTIIDWIPVFTRPDTAQIILDSLVFLQRERGLRLYGYVILENHMHWIAQAENLAKEVHSFKSYTAKMLVRYLEDRGTERILAKFAFHKKRHKDDREHQV